MLFSTKKINNTLGLLLFFIAFNNVFAQEYSIRGEVIDTNKKPIELAMIYLLNDSSNSLVQSTYTDSLGLFNMKVEVGNYLILIDQFGQNLEKRKLIITTDIDLGKIPVNNTSENLDELIIKTEKKLIEYKVDRLIFNIANSIASTNGDGLDAIKATPLLVVQNDQISMIGKSNVGIMLNGRTILLSNDDLIIYLKSIRSEDISAIEVITSPSSNYDASGNSGMINIITKKTAINTTSGSFRSGLSQTKYSTGNVGTTLNIKQNKWALSTALDYNNGSSNVNNKLDLKYPENDWEESRQNRRFSNTFSGRLAVDYQISNRATTGFQYRISNDKPLSRMTTTSLIYNTKATLDSIIKTVTNTDSKGTLHALNWYYQTQLDTVGKQITIDVDYLTQNNNLKSAFYTQSSSQTAVNSDYLSAQILGDKKIKIFTSKIDVIYPLTWVNLSFGGKLSFIQNEHDNNYYNTSDTALIFDYTRSNEFEYKENIQALYIHGTKQITPKTTLQLGLRTENTQTTSFSRTMSQKNKKNYWEWFPSLLLNYKFKEYSQLTFNYNRRIDRPGYNYLNPFRFYTSSTNYIEGNPFLKAYYTHNFELSYVIKNYYTALFYRDTRNAIAQINYVDPETYIQSMISENYYNQINYGWIHAYNFRYKNIWENATQFIISYTKTTSNISAIVPNISSWNGHFNTRNSFSLDSAKKYYIELNYMYHSSSVSQSYKTKSFSDLSTGFRLNLMSRNLQFTLEFTDILKTNKMKYSQRINDILQSGEMYNDNQKIRFTMTYNFGKQVQNNRRKQSNEEEEKRIL